MYNVYTFVVCFVSSLIQVTSHTSKKVLELAQLDSADSTGTTPSPTLFQTTTITSTTSATTTTEVIISAYDTTTASLDIGMHANDSTSTPKFADVITATSHRTDKVK